MMIFTTLQYPLHTCRDTTTLSSVYIVQHWQFPEGRYCDVCWETGVTAHT